MGKRNLFRYEQSGEDDGRRHYLPDGNLTCNRCGAVMKYKEDDDEGVGYYLCPKCRFIEVDEIFAETEEKEFLLNEQLAEYEQYWTNTDDEV